MRVILLTGELWGKAPRGSDIPAVKAYFGPLREDEGFEFFTTVEPDAPVGGPAFWRERADGSVQVDDGWAKIRIVISRVNQEF